MARSIVASRFEAGTLALALFFLALSPAPAAVDRSDPVRVVKTFHTSLLHVMKNAKALGYKGRYGALEPAIEEAFHLRLMSRMVTGRRHWKRFSASERDSFVTAFSSLVTATYAHRFDGYSGQAFRVLGSKQLRPKTVLVRTTVTGSRGTATKLNYLLRRFDDGWHAIDVYLKGSISEVATKRSEYASLLRNRGVNVLVERIREKAASLEKEATRKPEPRNGAQDN